MDGPLDTTKPPLYLGRRKRTLAAGEILADAPGRQCSPTQRESTGMFSRHRTARQDAEIRRDDLDRLSTPVAPADVASEEVTK